MMWFCWLYEVVTSSSHWERFVAKYEAAGMRISASKSGAMVLSRKRVECSLWVREQFLPQLEEFEYLRVLFTCEGKGEWEIDRRCCSNADTLLICRVEERAECKSALDLPVDLHPHPHLWSQTLVSDRKNKIVDTSSGNELSPLLHYLTDM